MRMPLKTLLGAAAVSIATQAAAEVTFYEGDAFRGRAFTVDGVVDNFAPTGFNDRARSAVVTGGCLASLRARAIPGPLRDTWARQLRLAERARDVRPYFLCTPG